MDDVIAYNPEQTILDSRVLVRKVGRTPTRAKYVVEINMRPSVIDYIIPGFYNAYAVNIPIVVECGRAVITDEGVSLTVRAFDVLATPPPGTGECERIISCDSFVELSLTDVITFFNGRYAMHPFMTYDRNDVNQPYPFMISQQPQHHPDFECSENAFAIVEMLLSLIEEHQPGNLLK